MWHHAHHVSDPQQLRPGYGAQFLQFHRGFIRRALDWYARQNYDPSLVAPWQGVPEQIRMAPCYDRSAEARILMQPQSFRTADELGLFIESSGLHGCIHETAADVYGEPDLNDFDIAPRNTVFYNIHGMIDGWYRNWEAAGQVNQGMTQWGGRFIGAVDGGDSADLLRYEPESGRWWLGSRHARGIAYANGRATLRSWQLIGESAELGARPDARFIRVWDVDTDGRHEVLYYSPSDGRWWEGRIDGGMLRWQEIKRASQQ